MGTKEYQAAWHQANKERRLQEINARKERVRAENRDRIITLKEDTPCADCKVNYPFYVMQFDHLRDKTINLSNRKIFCWSWPRIQAEIDKCEIVCANCHAVRTWSRNQ
jgi:hypothetical protein